MMSTRLRISSQCASAAVTAPLPAPVLGRELPGSSTVVMSRIFFSAPPKTAWKSSARGVAALPPASFVVTLDSTVAGTSNAEPCTRAGFDAGFTIISAASSPSYTSTEEYDDFADVSTNWSKAPS